MLKNTKGISIIILLILLVAILVAIGVMVYLGKNIIDEDELETIKTNALLIQGKAKTTYEKMKIDKKDEDLANALPGTRISLESIYIDVLNKAGVTTEEEKLKYYLWDKDTLISQEITEIKEDSEYLVNYENDVEVILIQGYEAKDGKIYYKLSEIKELDGV